MTNPLFCDIVSKVVLATLYVTNNKKKGERALPKVWIPSPKKMSQGQKDKGNFWHDKKRVEVITLYLSIGNMEQTSRITGVPVNTIRVWRKKDWWHEMERSIKEGEYQEVSSKINTLIRKSINGLEDRIENGEYILNSKTGKITRIPVKSRELHRIVTDGIRNLDTLETMKKDKEEDKTSQDESINLRLVKLAEQFAEFAMGKAHEKIIKGKILEGDYEVIDQGEESDALSKKRSETVQQGILPLPLKGETKEEQSTEKQCEETDDGERKSQKGRRKGRRSQESPDQRGIEHSGEYDGTITKS